MKEKKIQNLFDSLKIEMSFVGERFEPIAAQCFFPFA